MVSGYEYPKKQSVPSAKGKERRIIKEIRGIKKTRTYLKTMEVLLLYVICFKKLKQVAFLKIFRII